MLASPSCRRDPISKYESRIEMMDESVEEAMNSVVYVCASTQEVFVL